MSWFGVGRSDEDTDRKFTDRELTQRMFSYISPYKRSIILVTIIIIVNTAFSLAPPYITGKLLDLSIVDQEELRIGLIIGLVIGQFILSILTWLLGEYLQRVITIKTVTKSTRNIRMDMFHKLQNHDFRFFDTHITGKIMSRVLNDTDTLNDTLSFITQLIGNVLLVFGSACFLFYLNWKLALISIALTPVIFLLMYFYRKIVRKTMLNWRKTVAAVNAAMGESISGISVSKSFSREKKNFEAFKKINNENYRASYFRALTFATLWPIIGFLQIVVLVAIYLYGGHISIFNAAVTPGELYSFTLYLWRFFFPLTQVANFYSQYQAGLAAMERIFGMMDIESEVKQKEEPIILPELKGEIEFRNMDFWYNENEKVFENFSLKINAGEKVAFVGHTGAGKTTLASLIARFYEIKGGQILIDGVDIRNLHIEWYRQQVALVLQDSFLFSGTVKENIKMGRIFDDPSNEEILAAAKAVQATEFIEDFPEGFETDVLERGKRLSTGQRQLVTFARALLANPKILILDEATASVDAYTEAMIQDALETIMEGRTSIIIAHRLSTIKNADSIVMIENGKIVEIGNHENLLKKQGKYADLYETYFKHQTL
ncbi:MAG TPA: ABC transporter ATP-binding protein [candidate division Zixibacteria bacterium]|nr:ABC transporter ATP-binding protein [candidate division Zixibacteria bacterium]